MLGPSGFFLPNESETPYSDANDIELIHSSEEGFSELYRICKKGRFFVYKALKKEYRGNLFYEELLNKEFNIGFSLSHSGICQYFAKISHPVIGSCIVMEWIDGCTLEELITSGSINSRLSQKIICEICDALEYIHRKQIIHRDLKPENIMVTYNGQNVKIIDFGLSDSDSYNTFKAPAGTRRYAAPELIAGEQPDNRSDIWSLGVIINEFTGKKYRHITSRCLQHDRTRRYSSAEEIKNDIRNVGFRKLKRIALIIGIIAAACIAYFAIAGRDAATVTTVPAPVNAAPPAVAPADTSVSTVAPEATAPKTPTPETAPMAKEKPAAKPSDTPPADNIDADELEMIFNDAASSIL